MIKYMLNKALLVLSTLNPTSTLILAMLSFIAPIQSIMYGVLFLITADIITGIWASFKRNKVPFNPFKWITWQHITSAKLGKSISKSLVYLLVIISAYVVGTIIMQIPGLYVTKFFAGAIALREIKSLVENAEAILGGGFINDIRKFGKGGFKVGLENMFNENKGKDKPKQDDNITDNN